MNKVLLRGNLGVDPTLRYTATGMAVCNFTLATNERYRDSQGQLQERTEWHRIVVWGKPAENCAEYLSKGRQVFIEGSLRTRKWDDKEKITRYTTEIHTVQVDFFGGGDRTKDQRSEERSNKPQQREQQKTRPQQNRDQQEPDDGLQNPYDYGTPSEMSDDGVPF